MQSRLGEIKAVVNVGELHDSKSAKRFGQIAQTDAMLGQLNADADAQALQLADPARLAQRIRFHAAISPAPPHAIERLGQRAVSRLRKCVRVRHSSSSAVVKQQANTRHEPE